MKINNIYNQAFERMEKFIFWFTKKILSWSTSIFFKSIFLCV